MINPANWSPDYEKNIKKLEAEGYHLPRSQEELPEFLRRIVGGTTYLINDAGKVKGVDQASGEIHTVEQPPKVRPASPKPNWRHF